MFLNVIGRTGTLASIANWKAPFLNRLIPGSLSQPPSGKITILLPFFNSSSAITKHFAALDILSLYTGISTPLLKKNRITGHLNNSDFPILFNIFNDYGLLWENKTKPKKNDNSLRSSVGFGVKYYSPIGPIGFSWGFPIMDEDYDIKRMFLFSVGNLDWN